MKGKTTEVSPCLYQQRRYRLVHTVHKMG